MYKDLHYPVPNTLVKEIKVDILFNEFQFLSGIMP